MKFLLSIALAVVLAAPAWAVDPDKVPQHLLRTSVTVLAPSAGGSGGSSGSGSIVVRKFGEQNVAFVWTAYHVVDGLREIKTVLQNGRDTKVVTYRDPQIIQQLVTDGATVGETRLYCKVLACSERNDIAILQVRQQGFYTEGVEFILEDAVTPVSTELFHCGSPAGKELGHNSLTTGILAANGRLFDGEVYDQTTVSALGGSSGGIVCRKSDGKYVGMLTLGLNGADTFNYIVPVRRIVKWATDNKLRWAVDTSAPVPAYDELAKIPVEDTLRNPETAKSADQSPTPAPHSVQTMELDSTWSLWKQLLK